jgi:hypothetical protein
VDHILRPLAYGSDHASVVLVLARRVGLAGDRADGAVAGGRTATGPVHDGQFLVGIASRPEFTGDTRDRKRDAGAQESEPLAASQGFDLASAADGGVA